ncbi:MAG: c-type cytochrome [Alphaproteobacteria bacterium]
MKPIARNIWTRAWQAGVAVFAAAVVSGGVPSSVSAEDIQSTTLRGGRLYDNWYLETRKRAPKTAHPAYPADGAFARVPQQNWRCAECHGWDYAGRDGAFSKDSEHYTGIKGIRAMMGAAPAKVVAILKDKNHGFDEVLEDADLNDLAAFVTRGQVDVAQYVDRRTGLSRGNRRQHAAFYETVCVNCHGRDGAEMRQTMPLGRFSRESPYETLHKIFFGHPGAKMPASIVLGSQLVADTVAYLQELPSEEILASIVRGGRLYDNWISETRRTPPKYSHPAYPADRPLSNSPQDTWRCKECHGWDYMGRDGAYGSGTHATGIKGIRAMADASPSSIVTVLKGEKHQYGDELDALDLLDLANFVSKGQIAMDQFIDRATGKVKGDPTKYKSYYEAICSRCHGADGGKITNIQPIGQVARVDPWNTLHKILNGHPDEVMTPMRSFGPQVSADIVALLQALPAK